MKKSLPILTIAIVLLFAGSIMAHQQAVVIPLGGKKTVNVANFTGAWQPNTTYQAGQTVQIDGSTYVALVTHTSDPTSPNMGNWSLMAAKGDKGPAGAPGVSIAVYDSNDLFIGYYVANSQGVDFYARETGGYLAPLGTQVTGCGTGLICHAPVSRIFYLASDCTGSAYAMANSFSLLSGKPGTTLGEETQIAPSVFYIPVAATTQPLSLPVYAKDYDTGVCTEITWSIASFSFYQILPNDPAVTGFQNNYTAPFKTVVTVPPIP